MRPHAALPLALLAVLCCALCGGALAALAHADTASPSPSVSPSASPSPIPSASPTPAPAGMAVVTWAAKWQRAARRDRAQVVALRRDLGRPGPGPLPRQPLRSASEDVWTVYGHTLKRDARGARREAAADRRRIVAPLGSSAARWRPLLLLVGWPAAQLHNAVRCITLESGGRPWATNGFCDGLFQINRCHHLSHAFNALVNCRYALRLWRACGWYPTWTTMPGY